MYENNVHSVQGRSVSISQPYIRPIVRGGAAALVEFCAQLDVSLGEHGMARIGKLSFDAYNESEVLINAVSRYFKQGGHYPEWVLANNISNRKNINFCKQCGIRLSEPILLLLHPS